MNSFSQNVFKQLVYYVYLYIDPRKEYDNQIFYVGKGKGNRAFSHLAEESLSDESELEGKKIKRIREIKAEGLQPRIDILIHGLKDEEQALRIEASIIDLIGLNNLTNKQSGYHSATYGRMSVEQVSAIYNKKKIDIKDDHRVLLIKINKTFRYGMPEIELYDATRSAWKVDKNRKDKVQYVFSVYQGIVQEVYEVAGWFRNNSTYNSRKEKEEDDNDVRWEFVGKVADKEIRKQYLNKDVTEYVKDTQNPIRYINC
jgi:hypothetical protein